MFSKKKVKFFFRGVGGGGRSEETNRPLRQTLFWMGEIVQASLAIKSERTDFLRYMDKLRRKQLTHGIV